MRVALTGIALAALLGGTFLASAQSQLPPGLTRSGNVIMMRPIADSDAFAAPENGEHHAGALRVLAEADHDLYERAFDAADRGDWTSARMLADQGHDSLAARLIQWRYLLDRNSGASFAEIDGFMKANPEWPLRDALFARAEAAIGPELSAQGIVAWFGSRMPVSAIGKIRLGEALVATGETEEGRNLIQQGWIEGSFSPDMELEIVQKDGAFLTPDVDRRRLDDLLWRDDWVSAKRELARVDDMTQRAGEVRIALHQGESAEHLLDNLPQSVADDPGLLFDRARAARRAGDDAQAAALLLQIGDRAAARAHPEHWWTELNVDARQALQDGNPRTAYALVSSSGLSSGEEFADAEFLAGWIALRFLKEPHAALVHFERLEAGVTRPISKARANYWEGRAYEALGETAEAYSAYRHAAETPQTFYGQLALARIDPDPVLRVGEQPIALSSRTDFDKEELTHAMQDLADLGEENLLRIFALHDMVVYPAPGHIKRLAQELTEWGFREIAVRVAKTAGYDGLYILAYTHPVITVPTYEGPGTAPETPLVLGLIRQETEFDPDAVSGAGARGIMQLMPSAARRSATLAGIAYRPNDLTSDPSYNMQLGMTELEDDINQWSDSYVLAIAAYNAGRNNVQKWIVENGDPRSSDVDPIDWIEKIPFTETRNYVERVLENTEIYRNRLAGRDQPLHILADLYRPLTPPTKIVSYALPAASATPTAAVVVVPMQKPVTN